MRWLGLSLVSALLAAAQPDEIRVSAHAYTPPQVRLTVESRLVQLEVVVRDAHGHAVGGLKQGDFEILDEGKPRTIAAFSVEALAPAAGPASAPAAPAGSTTAPATSPPATPPSPAPPRSTLLFFDDLHAPMSDLQRVAIAARQFIKDGMGPGGRAAVYAASQGLTLDFTADTDALTAAIGKLRPHPRISENGIQSCPRMTPYQAYLIDNNLDYSAFNAALQEMSYCVNADPNERVNRGSAPAGPTGMDPNSAAVRSQAKATWEQARTDSLNSFAAIDNALAALSRAPGTRVLLMVSTGFLSGMLEAELDRTIDRAIHTGIVIDALDAKGLWVELPGRPLDEPHTDLGFPLQTFAFEVQNIVSRNDALNAVMAETASATGGLFFHNSNDLLGGFSQLAAVPETAYLLAFRPDAEGAVGKFRKLKVQLTERKGYYIQARPGYFAPGKAPAAAAGTQTELSPLDRQVLGSDVLTEIPIQVDGRLRKSEKGEQEVSLAIHVDVSPLKFAQRGGRHVQKLICIGALLDTDGNVVAAKEGVVDFALRNETLPRLLAAGLSASLALTAPPGSYRVRVVVQDADGKMASLNQSMEIPK
jgi:VWFA-related protein